MEAFVLDVSACVPWCCEDETTDASEELLRLAASGSRLHVPSLWTWEVLNAIAVIVRRQRIPASRGRLFLEQLATFNFRIDLSPPLSDFPRLLVLATHHGLTAYDVAYLDLAKRLSLPLATRDADLSSAALAEGLAVI